MAVTGEADRGRASERAAEIYAETITGRVALRPVSIDLVTSMAEWVADYETTHAGGTADNAKGYVKSFLQFFGGFDRLTSSGYSEYMRTRIAQVSRSTLRKELSSLRQFRAWAETERGIVLPAVPGLPKRGHPGARGKRARRRQATILSPAEIARILQAMPLKGPRSGAWVRPFFTIVWETSLRPYSTIARIEAPLHYRKGSKTLFIAREIDKVHYERTVPLTDAARKALNLVMPKDGGLLFPDANKDSLRESLEAALRQAGIKKTVSIYDFRHSRISDLANSGAPLPGVSFLVGHLNLATTAGYVTASADAAKAALSWGGSWGAKGIKSKNAEQDGASR